MTVHVTSLHTSKVRWIQNNTGPNSHPKSLFVEQVILVLSVYVVACSVLIVAGLINVDIEQVIIYKGGISVVWLMS